MKNEAKIKDTRRFFIHTTERRVLHDGAEQGTIDGRYLAYYWNDSHSVLLAGRACLSYQPYSLANLQNVPLNLPPVMAAFSFIVITFVIFAIIATFKPSAERYKKKLSKKGADKDFKDVDTTHKITSFIYGMVPGAGIEPA